LGSIDLQSYFQYLGADLALYREGKIPKSLTKEELTIFNAAEVITELAPIYFIRNSRRTSRNNKGRSKVVAVMMMVKVGVGATDSSPAFLALT
jgi:hypothetical protein